jgi:hypothetical protein
MPMVIQGVNSRSGQNQRDMLIAPPVARTLMKELPFVRDAAKGRVTVECAGSPVPVHTRCAYCRNCAGVVVQGRHVPAPQEKAWSALGSGSGSDDALLGAALQFNSLIRDGELLICRDDAGKGFRPR